MSIMEKLSGSGSVRNDSLQEFPAGRWTEGTNPKRNPLVSGFALLATILLVSSFAVSAGAISTSESAAAAAKVYVSNVTWDPAVFYPGDTGTVTFEVTNGNTDTGVMVNHATIRDTGFRITGGSYESSTNIGPGQIRKFTFSMAAPQQVGTYYPVFSLSMVAADSLSHTEMVRVDDAPLQLTLASQPDTFAENRKDTISVLVSNPRKNDVKNAVLFVSGEGLTAIPEKTFIGSITAGKSATVNISVTPSVITTLMLSATYDNGYNPRSATLKLPIVFNEDKKQAKPIVSNIRVRLENATYHVSGDVTNAGLANAYSVTLTTGVPAVPTDPYRTYIVGSLKPDDFSSFEVTFTSSGASSVPLKISYKDKDGNIFTSDQAVLLSGANSTQENGIFGFLTVAAIIVIALGAGVWFYRKRKTT